MLFAMNSMENAQTANCQVQECMQVSFLTFTKKCKWKEKKIFIPLRITNIKLSIQSKHNKSHLLFVLLSETEQVYANFKKFNKHVNTRKHQLRGA
jgi:hypothetical protein